MGIFFFLVFSLLIAMLVIGFLQVCGSLYPLLESKHEKQRKYLGIYFLATGIYLLLFFLSSGLFQDFTPLMVTILITSGSLMAYFNFLVMFKWRQLP